MLSEKMAAALNAQVNAELYSAYLYLSMSAYLESVKLPGFGHWMRAQAGEEQEHAMKLYGHVVERGGRVLLEAVPQPATEWNSPLAAFQAAFGHEQKVTKMIADLVAAAEAEGDGEAVAFLQWFVKEQVEEEASADEVVQKLTLAGGRPDALRTLDDALSKRGDD